MRNVLVSIALLTSLGCSSGDSGPPGAGGSPDAAGATDAAGTPDATGAMDAADAPDAGGDVRDGSGGEPWRAGAVATSCTLGVPADGQPLDVSHPTSVVGTGTGASCTHAALAAAIAKGGTITFDCGESPVTIAVTATLSLPTNKDSVLDGGRKVTLDGQHQVQILRFDSPGWMTNEHRVTLQHIALVNGNTTPKEAIPQAPAPCSQGFNDGEGGALYMRDGSLTVIDAIFRGNRAAPRGPDTGGGAIYLFGSKSGALVASSTFVDNAASNAGAIGALFGELRIYDSLFRDNEATGDGANNDDASRCSAINNGQHQVGSGGNGGALYSDGTGKNVYLCGDEIEYNSAGEGAFGGGLFFTSNDMSGDLSIIDSKILGNAGGNWTNVATGTIDWAGSGVGTNCHSITVERSTVQGWNP